MKTLIITGWMPGLDKITLTNVIRKYTGVGLAAGKQHTDEVIEHRHVRFMNLEAVTAKNFLADILAIGAIGYIVPELESAF